MKEDKFKIWKNYQRIKKEKKSTEKKKRKMNSSIKIASYVFLLAFFSGLIYAAEVSSVSTPPTQDINENSGISKEEPIRYQGKTRFNYINKVAHFNNENNDVAAVSPKTNLRASSPTSPLPIKFT